MQSRATLHAQLWKRPRARFYLRLGGVAEPREKHNAPVTPYRTVAALWRSTLKIITLVSFVLYMWHWLVKHDFASRQSYVKLRLGLVLYLPLAVGALVGGFYAWHYLPAKLQKDFTKISTEAIEHAENATYFFSFIMAACVLANVGIAISGLQFLFHKRLHKLDPWVWLLCTNSTAFVHISIFFAFSIAAAEAQVKTKKLLSLATQGRLRLAAYIALRDQVAFRSSEERSKIGLVGIIAFWGALAALYTLYLVQTRPKDFGQPEHYSTENGLELGFIVSDDLYYITLLGKEAILLFGLMKAAMDVNDTADAITSQLLDGPSIRQQRQRHLIMQREQQQFITISPLAEHPGTSQQPRDSTIKLTPSLSHAGTNVADQDHSGDIENNDDSNSEVIAKICSDQERLELVLHTTTHSIRPENLISFEAYWSKPHFRPMITYDLASVRVTRPLFYAGTSSFVCTVAYLFISDLAS